MRLAQEFIAQEFIAQECILGNSCPRDFGHMETRTHEWTFGRMKTAVELPNYHECFYKRLEGIVF